MCDYCYQKAHGQLLIIGTPDFPFPASAVKIDDFNDSNLTNALTAQGVWEGFSDKSDGIAGGASAKPSPLTLGAGKTGKGLQYRMTATTGAAHPYAGVKTAFRSDKAAVSLGAHASSVMFDLDPTTSGKVFRVELEQPDITDGAYWGASVTTGAYDHWTRLAVPLSSFAQPSWATAARPLNKQNVTALRFVIYDAGNSLGLTLDNVYIDSMTLGPAGVRAAAARAPGGREFRASYRKGLLEYIFPYDASAGQRWTAAVFSAGGRMLLRQAIDPLKTGGRIALSAQSLPAGCYVLVHARDGVEQPGADAFVVTRR